MPIWKIAPVSEEPEVSLLQWCILETSDGSRHFVGQDQRDCTGRVSSAVFLFDPIALRGTTRSGRVYQLVGTKGWENHAQYVWSRWCEVNNVTSYTDVTERMLSGAQT
ncbi:hypothetical protein P3T23_001019 [Paraburkholderia sp. GAS448]